MQLLRDQSNGHQARVVVTLSHNQNIVFDVFVDHVPRIFAALFGAADTQTFTLAESVVHQPLVLTNLIAVNGDDFARLCRQVAPPGTRGIYARR
ncbi:hypothetical protein HR12_39110 [Microbacterium sp. SUBG005]|nr:hypothetical protein HR12_39110 [Microbacterium sp. SUBG005]